MPFLSAWDTNRIIVNKELILDFLYFSVSHRTNRFVYAHKDRCSKQQEETYSLIKSLHDLDRDTGLFQDISIHKIHYAKRKIVMNSVYLVQKYKMCQERLKIMTKEIPVWLNGSEVGKELKLCCILIN